jgi:hypothetical protein
MSISSASSTHNRHCTPWRPAPAPTRGSRAAECGQPPTGGPVRSDSKREKSVLPASQRPAGRGHPADRLRHNAGHPGQWAPGERPDPGSIFRPLLAPSPPFLFPPSRFLVPSLPPHHHKHTWAGWALRQGQGGARAGVRARPGLSGVPLAAGLPHRLRSGPSAAPMSRTQPGPRARLQATRPRQALVARRDGWARTPDRRANGGQRKQRGGRQLGLPNRGASTRPPPRESWTVEQRVAVGTRRGPAGEARPGPSVTVSGWAGRRRSVGRCRRAAPQSGWRSRDSLPSYYRIRRPATTDRKPATT